MAFLLTDVEGSTRAWEADPPGMAAAMDRHNAILDEAVSAHGGVSPPAQGEGDSIVAAFARASDAVRAAVTAQRSLTSEPWSIADPLRVRMAVHAGEARFIDDGNYAGHAIIRTARLRAIAQGGQILVSTSAHDLTVDQLGEAVAFRDLGEHRLRDLARPERVWQVIGDGLSDDFEPLRSLDAHPHNLPVQLSSFVGRTDEVATLVRLMTSERLVTITGAGGAGKTRLAQQVAAELLESLPAGAWWVELADLEHANQIPGAIARSTGIKAEVGDQEMDALVARLDGERLLVLDNCEHLIAGVATLVDVLLRRCPSLRILATSRESLAVDGEVAWRIPPLGVPPITGLGEPTPVAALGQYDAVRLFLDRAQRVRPNFHLDDASAPIVADICQRLDGIPLALELAASRCRSMAPQGIRDGLIQGLELLAGGGRAALPRQQTLEASIAWSHALLDPAEQILFRRLAVFRGGCALDDIEAIVADDLLPAASVLDLLDRLVVQSLVVVDDGGPGQRFRMLETVRQYGTRRLAEADEVEALTQSHARHFVDHLLAIGPHLEDAFDFDEFRWIAEEMENLDAAIRWAVESGERSTCVDALWHLALAWGLVDPPACERLFAVVIDAIVGDRQLVAKALVGRAHLRMWAGDVAQSAMDAMAGIDVAEEVGDGWVATRGRTYLGQVIAWVDPEAGNELQRRVIIDARESGDLVAEALATIGLGSTIAGLQTRQVDGLPILEEGWELAVRLGNPLVLAWAAAQLGIVAAFGARFEEAERLAGEAERTLDAIGRTLGVRALRLAQGTIIGGVIAFTRSYCASQWGEDSAYLESLPAMADEVARAGYLMTPSLLEISFAVFAGHQGRTDEAEASFARCIAYNELAGTEATTVSAAALWCDYALAAGDLVEARRRVAMAEGPLIAQQSYHARCRIGLRHAALALVDGEPLVAEGHVHDVLALAVEQQIPWEMLQAMEMLVQVAAVTGSMEEAARIAGIAASMRSETGIKVELVWHRERRDEAIDAARTALGDDAFDRAFIEGGSLSADDAVAYVRRARGERKRPSFGWDGLTPTEERVVEHVMEGRTNPEIAEAMFISRETVKTHLSHIFTKLGVTSRAELAARAARRAG